jgi:type VI secretion system secreted protein VgrG
MSLMQENRTLLIATPLGDDAVLLTRFSGSEGISLPFSFDLALVSENNNLEFKKIIGQNVTVSIGLQDGNRRFFNGIISRFICDSGAGGGPGGRGLAHYSAKMVPWFWLLTRTANSRIFEEKSVSEIVEQIFNERGFKDFRMDLGNYDPKEYCVQYNETDFNFISRLLEQEGIFYFFEHEDGKHTMVLADSASKHKPCPNHASVRYHTVSAGEGAMEGVITDLDKMQEIRIGKYTVKDYNFENPNADLMVEVPSNLSLGPGEREFFDFPAEYANRPEGERLANLRLQAEEARITTITGEGTCKGFSSGFKFDLAGGHYRDELNEKSYVLVSVNHNASESAGGSGDRAAATYSNRFTCMPFDIPYRPPLLTPKPMIAGTQTAIVMDDEDPEKYGRVKVKFHWDRQESASCWIRVGQTWAGTKWGAVFIPRIGHEVIVNFIEGDPDRPIIVGSVYNGLNEPPYELPAEKTKSTIRSERFNEIRFDDKDGEEQIFIQAERNQDIRTKNDRLEWVGQDSHLIIKKDQLEEVEGNKHLTVSGDHNEKVDGTISVNAGTDMQEKVGGKHALDAAQEIHLKAGMKVVIEAGTQLTIKAGGSFVDIGPAGVSITGTMVQINSGGSPGAGSGSSPEAPKEPLEADSADPGGKAETQSSPSQPSPGSPPPPTPQGQALKSASESGTPFCET